MLTYIFRVLGQHFFVNRLSETEVPGTRQNKVVAQGLKSTETLGQDNYARASAAQKRRAALRLVDRQEV